MSKIFPLDGKDIYAKDKNAPLVSSGKAFYGGRIYSYHTHERALKVKERVSQFFSGVGLTLLSLGVAPLISSKVREWLRGGFLGKNVWDIYLIDQASDKASGKLQGKQVKEERTNFWENIIQSRLGEYAKSLTAAFIESSIEKSQYERIYLFETRDQGSDIPFQNDGPFGDHVNEPNKKCLLVFLPSSKKVEERLNENHLRDCCDAQPTLQEFCDSGNDIYVMKWDDVGLAGIPKELRKLIEGVSKPSFKLSSGDSGHF